MPFTYSTIVHISSIASSSNSVKCIYHVDAQVEEDDWVSIVMIIFSDVLPASLNINDYVFITGKAVWVNSQLQVSISHIN